MKGMVFAACLGSLSAAPRLASAQAPFVHPGILHTTADLDRMKAMVAARAEPYTAGWNKLRADGRAQVGYTPHPYAVVQRIPDTVSYEALNSDAIAAHLNAIEWVVTGDIAYARKAVQILNSWSSTLTTLPSTGDPVLTGGLTAYQLAAAAEVIRATFPEWIAADRDRLRVMLQTKFYPVFHNFLLYHEPDGLVHTNTGVNQHFFASWDAIAMASMAAIGVFADDRVAYQEALDAFKNGTGNGAIMRAVFDGDTGQLQESGRDPEHAQLGIGLLATLCEIAWNQGDDLYGYADNRLLKGFEYTASYLLGNDVPFRMYTDPFRTYTAISTEFTAAQIVSARANPRPIYEMVWNHYVNRRGVAAPFTQQVAQSIRPEGYRADHIGFGTLLFTRAPGLVTPPDGGTSDVGGGERDVGTGGTADATGAGGTVGPPGTGGAGVSTGTGGAAGPTAAGGATGAVGGVGGTRADPALRSSGVSGGCACRAGGGAGSTGFGGGLGAIAAGAWLALSAWHRRRSDGGVRRPS